MSLLGWKLPCEAVVIRERLDAGGDFECYFNVFPVHIDGVKAGYKNWSFKPDGQHICGLFDALIPPGDPVAPDGQYKLNGEPVTIFTTLALGALPVIAQARDGQLLRFSRFGRGEAGILEK